MRRPMGRLRRRSWSWGILTRLSVWSIVILVLWSWLGRLVLPRLRLPSHLLLQHLLERILHQVALIAQASVRLLVLAPGNRRGNVALITNLGMVLVVLGTVLVALGMVLVVLGMVLLVLGNYLGLMSSSTTAGTVPGLPRPCPGPPGPSPGPPGPCSGPSQGSLDGGGGGLEQEEDWGWSWCSWGYWRGLVLVVLGMALDFLETVLWS